jgi:hypothetical protein
MCMLGKHSTLLFLYFDDTDVSQHEGLTYDFSAIIMMVRKRWTFGRNHTWNFEC